MDGNIQLKFKEEFKSIVYQYSQIEKSKSRLRQLHVWDKMGSHEKAILKEMDVKKELNDKLNIMLKGRDYEEWKIFSRKLTTLNSRLKASISMKEKCEKIINELNF